MKDGFLTTLHTRVPSHSKIHGGPPYYFQCCVFGVIQLQLEEIRRVHLIMKYPLRAAKMLDTKQEHNRSLTPKIRIPFLLQQQKWRELFSLLESHRLTPE